MHIHADLDRVQIHAHVYAPRPPTTPLAVVRAFRGIRARAFRREERDGRRVSSLATAHPPVRLCRGIEVIWVVVLRRLFFFGRDDRFREWV